MSPDPLHDAQETKWDRVMANHAASLIPGTRVKVRLGECPRMLSWHGTIEDGATGIIYHGRYQEAGAPPDHVYLVYFDQPLRARKTWLYCAVELIVLAEDADTMEQVGDPQPWQRGGEE